MRRDWRGPSSSSTMRRVGLLAGPAFCAGGGSEVVSKRERKGVAVKAVGAIGECALRDRARGSVSVLVGKVPIEMIVALADTHAEDVAGPIWDNSGGSCAWRWTVACDRGDPRP